MHAVLMAFCAFVSTGFRPRTPLARGIVAALGLKLCVVVAMRLFLFGGDDRVTVDESLMDRHLIPVTARNQGN